AGFRIAARRLLDAAGFEVVGEAVDGRSALLAASALQPGIVLLDVQLPDLDGFEVAERLASSPRPPQIVLTSSRDVATVRWRLDANPAWTFIPKNKLSRETLAAAVGG